jgi:isopenicillin-N epimerase
VGTVADVALSELPWLLDPKVAYLNHGGYGALAQPVAEAAAALRLEMEANPTDLFTRQWQPRIDAVRDRVARLLRARPEDLVFVANATAGTATVLASFPFTAGDHVVTTDHRYPAVHEQLTGVLARRGVETTEVPVPLDLTTDDEIVATIMAAVTPATRLVVVDHIASPTGFVFPVAAIARAAHEAGVAVAVDAAHAPGQVDVDLPALGVDFWSGNLHKWVSSPRAAAVLSVAPKWQDVVRPLAASTYYADGFQPAFDWTGTFDPIPVLAIPAALDMWESLGWDRVRSYQRDVATRGAHHVADVLRTRVVIDDRYTAAMRLVELPVRLPTGSLLPLVTRLITEHAVVAHVTEHQGSTYVRMCGQIYNRPEDYERLAAALVAELVGTIG